MQDNTGVGFGPQRDHRHSIEKKASDYRELESYFTTICTWGLACLFGEVVDCEMRLNNTSMGVRDMWGDVAILVGVDPRVNPPTTEPGRISDRGGDYLTTMINLLKQQGGVLFPGGKKMELQNLRALNIGYLHAEAETAQNGKSMRVAVSFGPQYGPVTATQANEAIQTAKLNAYDALILAGFSIEAEAQAFVQKAKEVVKGLSIHFGNVAPDVLVGDLLKTTRASQIFTVFGQPDVGVQKHKDGTYRVELRGVDIYDPLTGKVHSARGEDVAAWFLDTDYDGMTFHICQAFFPGDADAWEKLQRALKAQIDPEAFEQMRGTVSFPFEPGEHKRIAVKVIDFQGNEVVRVVSLGGTEWVR